MAGLAATDGHALGVVPKRPELMPASNWLVQVASQIVAAMVRKIPP